MLSQKVMSKRQVQKQSGFVIHTKAPKGFQGAASVKQKCGEIDRKRRDNLPCYACAVVKTDGNAQIYAD